MTQRHFRIGMVLIAASALSLAGLTLASAQDQGMNAGKGATGEQVKVCQQQRSGSGYFGGGISREQRIAIRLQYRACVLQAVSLNVGHVSSRSSQSSIIVVPPAPGCSNLYWFDQTNGNQCQARKLFCGAFMYFGLQTFSRQKDCFDALTTASCTPHWRCDWGTCTNGWQSQTPVDSNNCGAAAELIACPALARRCALATQCKADSDCPQIACIMAPCPTNQCENGQCVISTTFPSVTILSPNGGETYKNDGSPITINWTSKNVPSSQKLDVIRLRAYPNGQEYNVAFNVLNDGQEVVIPFSIPVGAYTLEIKTYVNGSLVMDSSDSYFKIIDVAAPVVSEQVKCIFNGAKTEQRCTTAYPSYSPLSFTCNGLGSCVAEVKGPQGTSLMWKSSCGGYAYSTLDGTSEYVNFFCRDTASGS